jgi:AraC-like DNA-binding protein
MKQIVCGLCNDFRAIAPKGQVSCRCGNVVGWWVNPERGIAKVYAKYKEYARILGMHNTYLQFAFKEEFENTPPTFEQWRRAHTLATELSEGYLFHKDKIGCPFVLIKIGESNDVSWATVDEVAIGDITNVKDSAEKESRNEGH